jgi:hypothetical protein
MGAGQAVFYTEHLSTPLQPSDGAPGRPATLAGANWAQCFDEEPVHRRPGLRGTAAVRDAEVKLGLLGSSPVAGVLGSLVRVGAGSRR